MPRALLSVSDKTGIVDLGRGLVARGFEIVSTGGTARALSDAGLAVTNVSAITGFPEMMDGRVKTLHPAVHGGILARRDHPDDLAAARELGIAPIDVVVVNLYPFERTAARRDVTFDELVEQIDIGGPSMVRAAAKNFTGDLRYGENPHQPAAWYVDRGAASRPAGLGASSILQGRELSYTNLLDLDAGARIVLEFSEPAAAVIKHTNPCGVATGSSAADAYLRAREADPLAAYGGIVGLNRPIDRATAEAIASTFIEAVIAPGLELDAREVLQRKPNMRVVVAALDPELIYGVDLRSVLGALLVQYPDRVIEARHPWAEGSTFEGVKVATRRAPSADEWEGLRF